MNITLPDEFDQTVRSMGVTFWSDADHIWVLQWSPNQPQLCIARIKGVSKQLTVAFDPNELYRRLLNCLASNELPMAPDTEWPSLNIGIAFEKLTVHSSVRATAEGLKTFGTSDLATFLRMVIASAPELAANPALQTDCEEPKRSLAMERIEAAPRSS